MADMYNPFNTDEVVGVAPAGETASARHALIDAGFEVEVLEGPIDADAIDVEGENVGSKILRFFQQGEALDSLKRFKTRLEAGDDIIRVLAVGDRAAEAGQIFVDNGGETIWHYGKWTFQQLHS